MISRAKQSSSQLMYQGKIFTVRHHAAIEPGGVPVRREVVHHRGSAVVLPRMSDGRILLVRQFRFPAGRFLWELPAGSLDPGETPLQTARRELAEETGYRATKWRKLVEFFASPGFLDEKMTIFLAQDIRPGIATPEADERIQARFFEVRELQTLIRQGKLRDGKTLIGLLVLFDFESGAMRRAR
ncbi:MAG: NUDIX hydrolase [Acidobacteria bacterium]|nr:NUDIX hydrolase [Acidobacteriota bacterium]